MAIWGEEKEDLMYIPQFQLERLKRRVAPGKVVVIYGPRRTGKTTLIKHFLDGQEDYLLVNGEDLQTQEELSSQSISKLKGFVGEKKLLVIDEAQNIPQVGLNLKLIVDHIPDVMVIATGSSSFDLARQVGEPLTGRRRVLNLFPLSQMELDQVENGAERKARLDSRLIYGSYPETVLSPSDAERSEYLRELVSSYLYKDILAVDGVKKSQKMIQLLQLIAHQVGKEVSYNELGTQLGMSKNTVERYLNLLEQVFVLVNIRGLSRNLRSEVTRTSRYYFYDLGIRNALINNFNSLGKRNDVGALWENYLVMERLKKQEYHRISSNNFFWRTYEQQEIDWVEEREGNLFGFEFKWKKTRVRPPKQWVEAYPEASFELISQDNYLDFIT